ncbi:MAG TPA: hypothetical protein VJG13_12190, partial [Thermoanaerobaculia bacterium]|nr:hypothetical protein [Thermoanaerobaculia bacterium]
MAGSVRLRDGHRYRFRGPADELARLRALGAHLAPSLTEDVELRMVEGRPALRSGAPLAEAAEDIYLVEADADRRILAILDRRRELTRRPQVFLEVRDAGTALSIHLARDDRYHRKLARWFLFGALAALGAIRFAHASFVSDGARAALILGPHRSGKSTLVAAALLAGWRIAAEGVSLIDDAGRVVPFFMDGYPVLRLTRPVWREVRGALPGELPEPELYPSRGAGVGEKVVLPVASYWPNALETRPMRASVAWLPAVDRAEPLRIDPVPRRAALASAARELEDRR